MSGLLAGKVWQSNLESHLKPLAAAMADIANDDGSRIYPSVAYLAWLLGKGERSVQQGLAELKALGVLQVVAFESGGRNHPTEYHLIEGNLPQRPSWKEFRKGAENAPFTEIKGATNDRERVHSTTQRVQLSTERVKCTAPDPLVREPSIEPLLEPPYSGSDFLQALESFKEARRQMKKPLTFVAEKLLYKKLGGWPEVSATAALTDSVINRWQGVFEPKNGAGNGTNKPVYQTAAERRASRFAGYADVFNELSQASDSGVDEVLRRKRLGTGNT